MRSGGLFVCLMVLMVLLPGCRNNGAIAEGDDFLLTVDDLRFEVTKLGPSARYEDTYEGRQGVVERIVARHLLAGEALERGLGVEDIEETEAQAEAYAVAEAYHKWKIDKMIMLPRIKTKVWLDRLDRRLHVKDLVFAVYPVAVEARRLIEAGRDFESLAEELSQRQDVDLRDLGWIIWKDLSREVANVLFRVDTGSVSDVINGADGYHLFYVAEDEKFGLSLELLSLRSKRFVTAIESERLIAAEKRELAGRYDLAFSQPGISAGLEAFGISFEGRRPPDSLATHVIATYDGGEILVADLYNDYYSKPVASRPYVGDFNALRQYATDIVVPRLETLAGYDMGFDRLREVIWAVKKAREDLLVPMMEGYFRNQIEITDQDIAAYYAERSEDLVTAGHYHTRRILLETDAEARQVLRQLQMGSDFAELAKEVSTDEFTAPRGGDLGTLSYGVIAVYDSVVSTLRPGEVSRPFTSDAGVEILKLESKEEPRRLAFEEAVPQIRQFIANSGANELLAEWVSQRKQAIGYSLNEDLLKTAWLPLPGFRQKPSKQGVGQATLED